MKIITTTNLQLFSAFPKTQSDLKLTPLQALVNRPLKSQAPGTDMSHKYMLHGGSLYL